MGFYVDHLLPRALDLAMATKPFREVRQACLADVTGTVLEVGFGSGLNLPFYPRGVQKVVAIDPSTVAAKLARRRIAEAPFPVEHLPLSGDAIPGPDAQFDSVVSTFTLCTIPDPLAALRQMRRVLKPEGRFFFVEHGRSDEPSVQRWQDRLNPLQRVVAGGCHLNRDIAALITNAGFELCSLERQYAQGPKFIAYLYSGVARGRD